MRRLDTCAALLVLCFTLFGCANMPVGNKGSGWATLFDGGKGLDNFNRVGEANWHIQDGVVVADSKTGRTPGYLVTKRDYGDFQLHVEFWVSDDANSGVFLRCANPNKITDKSCYEANIFDQRPDPTYGTGAITHLAEAPTPMPKAGGKWNTYDITAKGPEVTVVLNGVQTAHMRDTQLATGPFALQYGQGVVKFRKVEVRPL
jgi:3-keto-disaccharide hydrolase